jgi:hypothetical protein
MRGASRRIVCGLLAILIVAAPPRQTVLAARSERRLTWAQAARLLPGYQLEVRLPDGERIWGRCLSTSPDSLRLDVQASTDRTRHPRGITTIPQTALSTVKRRRPGLGAFGDRGEHAQAVGAGIGAAASAPFALGLGETGHERTGLLVMIGGAAAGAWIAHRLSDPTLVIVIIPDTSTP